MTIDLQQELEEAELSQTDEEAGIRVTQGFQSQLRYFLRFHKVWNEIERREFQIDNLHQELLEHTVFTPEKFVEICSDGSQSLNALYGILDRNGLSESISEAISSSDHSELNSYKSLLSEGLHTEDEDELDELMEMIPNTEPFPSEQSIQLWKSGGIESLVDGSDFLKYAALSFESEYISYGYELDIDQDLFQQLSSWEVELQKRIGDYSRRLPDGGSPTVTTIAGTAGQIVAGAYAVGHDSFVDPNHSSIVAGSGLIASGLHGWPDDDQLEQELRQVRERLDELD